MQVLRNEKVKLSHFYALLEKEEGAEEGGPAALPSQGSDGQEQGDTVLC
jgi:hypothetical protein